MIDIPLHSDKVTDEALEAFARVRYENARAAAARLHAATDWYEGWACWEQASDLRGGWFYNARADLDTLADLGLLAPSALRTEGTPS